MGTFFMQVNDSTEGEAPGGVNVWVPDDLAQSGDGSTPPRDQDELKTLIDALCIGTLGRSELITRTVHQTGTTVKPTSELAQKEVRFKVTFRDTVTLKYGSFTIPCADLTQVKEASEFVDIETGPGADLKNWLNAYGESDVGNAIQVTSIKFVTV